MSQLDETEIALTRSYFAMAAFLWPRYPRYARRLVDYAADIIHHGLFADDVHDESTPARTPRPSEAAA